MVSAGHRDPVGDGCHGDRSGALRGGAVAQLALWVGAPHRMEPPVPTPQVWTQPAPMAAASVMAVTGAGVMWPTVVPSPSWPYELLPQQSTVPPAWRAPRVTPADRHLGCRCQSRHGDRGAPVHHVAVAELSALAGAPARCRAARVQRAGLVATGEDRRRPRTGRPRPPGCSGRRSCRHPAIPRGCSPALHRAARHQGTRAGKALGDGGGTGDAGHRDRDAAAGHGAVAQLAPTAGAPTPHGAVGHEGATVVVACGDLHRSRDPDDRDRQVRRRGQRREHGDRAVSQLAVHVRAPARHRAGFGQGTGVAGAGCDLGDPVQARWEGWSEHEPCGGRHRRRAHGRGDAVADGARDLEPHRCPGAGPHPAGEREVEGRGVHAARDQRGGEGGGVVVAPPNRPAAGAQTVPSGPCAQT